MDFENDKIRVTGKSEAAQHIIGRYNYFGWTLTENKEDKFYGDIRHMTFTRPHFIDNKDELQLLQVRLEIAYNNSGKLAQKSKRRAALLIALAALIVAAFIAGGVFLILNGGLLPIIFGSASCVFGLGFSALGGIFAHRSYLKDSAKYGRLILKEKEKIDMLCKRAKELRGVNE